jgi:hypothetical protein
MMQMLSLNNSSVLTKNVNAGEKYAKESSAAMGGILERQNEERGIAPSAGQQNTINRLVDVNTAENVANAKNMARANIRTQDEQILLGSAPNPNIGKTNTSTGG